jgi:hypothetical protein
LGEYSSPVASGFKQTALDCLMFAHINMHNIHFLIRGTAGMNNGATDTRHVLVLDHIVFFLSLIPVSVFLLLVRKSIVLDLDLRIHSR